MDHDIYVGLIRIYANYFNLNSYDITRDLDM